MVLGDQRLGEGNIGAKPVFATSTVKIDMDSAN